MNKPKTSGKGLIKYTLIVPVLLVMLLVSNAQNVVAELQNSTQKKSTKLKKETVKFTAPKIRTLKYQNTIKFIAPVIKKDSVYEKVETPPSFTGGESALMKYLAENIRYPVIAQENGAMGKIIAKFVINREGKIENAEIAKTEMKELMPELTVVGYGKNDKEENSNGNKTKESFEKAKKALENEALRVINNMPQWIPGKNKGENVNVVYQLPINFKLQ